MTQPLDDHITKICQEKLDSVKMFYPCVYQTPEYNSGYWLCSATALTKSESERYILRHKDTYTTVHSIKIPTSAPNKFMMHISNLNPFGNTLYDFDDM